MWTTSSRERILKLKTVRSRGTHDDRAMRLRPPCPGFYIYIPDMYLATDIDSARNCPHAPEHPQQARLLGRVGDLDHSVSTIESLAETEPT